MVFLEGILPASEAFREGVLAASSSAFALAGPGWLGCETNAALVSLTVILFLSGLRNLFHLVPWVGGCVIRWRGNLTLEHSVQLARERTYAAVVCLLGFCLLLDRTGFAAPSFVEDAAPGWRVPLRLGIAAGYLLLRRLAFSAVRFGRMPSETRKASHTALYNYFILVAAVCFLATGAMMVFGASDGTLRRLVTVLTVAGFALFSVRKLQLLGNSCSFLLSFLYLCALELLPAAGLIVAIELL